MRDRTRVSEGTDTNKTDGSCECIICHYWYFLRINFRFQSKVCGGCHDMKIVIYDLERHGII